MQAVKRRVDHLKEYDKSSLSKMEIWRRQRYERILVDFLFRTRCFETAQALAKATGIEVCFVFFKDKRLTLKKKEEMILFKNIILSFYFINRRIRLQSSMGISDTFYNYSIKKSLIKNLSLYDLVLFQNEEIVLIHCSLT